MYSAIFCDFSDLLNFIGGVARTNGTNFFDLLSRISITATWRIQFHISNVFVMTIRTAHGVGRVVGALGSEAGFSGSMLN